MPQTIALQELASVRFGSRKAYSSPQGEVRFIQGRDISPRHGVEWERTDRMPASRFPEEQLLSPWDVLFLAKGSRNLAVTIEDDLDHKAVASTAFMIVRPKDERLNPDFLAHFLNSDQAQHHLLRYMRQTTVKMIGKKELLSLRVPLPSPEEQDRIVGFAELMEEEEWRLKLMLRKRKEQLEAIFHNLADSEN